MRDGERRECPIVPTEAINLRYGEGEEDYLAVSATHDSIQMFPDPRYTYLRYWNHITNEMQACFLAEEVMADLADGGIPVTIRDSITELEHNLYENHVGRILAAQVVEVEEVPETLTDAEIDYYLNHEWGNGDAA